MKRKNKYYLLTLIFIILSLSVFFICFFNKSNKIEMIEKSNEGLSLTFSSLNQSVTHQLKLDNSDVLVVDSLVDKGTLRLSVTSSQGNVIYTGGLKKETEFTIQIKASDLYSVVVSGRNTSGTISIQRK